MTTMRGRGGEDWSGDRRSGTGRYRDPRWSTRPEPTKDTSAKDTSAWHWLLMVPIVLPLWIPFYNRVDPRLSGVPFFYWGQLAFALLSAAVVGIVHLTTKRR